MTLPAEVSCRRLLRFSRFVAWGVFVIALLTYWLTLEPTASYWDCPEYIAVADKMQVGHSPGNPMWMLAARLVLNFAPSPADKALMANALSGLFTAIAVALLYVTICLFLLYGRHGSRDNFLKEGTISFSKAITCVGAGVTGALAFCWSDSMWFSAVEAEVYAFSIMMTALTLYVTLWWAWAAYGHPHASRWIVLAAYLTGAGMGVHELNLLCLPAIALIVWHRVRPRGSTARSWLALLVGSLVTAAILFLFVPGFLGFAKSLELWMVNRMRLPFNSGLIAAWTIVFLLVLAGCLTPYVVKTGRLLRLSSLALWCVLMLFVGFSCYALIVIRGYANPPLNTGAPGNIFSFSGYYDREQYGSVPLLRGYAFGSPRLKTEHEDSAGNKTYHKYYNTSPQPRYVAGRHGDKALLRNGFATSADSLQAVADSRRSDDFYLMADYTFVPAKSPEMLMWFSRMHSDNPDDIAGYYNWSGMSREEMVMIPNPTLAVDEMGHPVKNPELPADTLYRPTYLHNLSYLLGYQIGFMYFRYFLWNFMGRQNDLTGHGEPDAGLPATGIVALDRLWSDPAGVMPTEASDGNPGRNVYWFLPLALGIAGCMWQLRRPGRERRCAAAVAALFFFTGVAIVLYLNQTPGQARDRDYAFLGSYYAFCIWIGVGVVPLGSLIGRLFPVRLKRVSAIVAAAVALLAPLRILSQTCDDHDRSGRTAVTDMAYNIMAPLPENAIIFVDGDNTTFPLWYMQATEELRRDVRVVCLTYLADPDYAASLLTPVWDAAPLAAQMPESHLRMGRYAYASLSSDTAWRDLREVMKEFYATQSSKSFPRLCASRVYMPFAEDTVRMDLRRLASGNTIRQQLIFLLDVISSTGDNRPMYWISANGDAPFGGQLKPFMRYEGPVMRLSPSATAPADDKALADALNLYRSGSADRENPPYFDPVAARQMQDFRRSLVRHAVSMSRIPGKEAETLLLIGRIRSLMPEAAVPFKAYVLPDRTYTDEGTELALAMLRVASAAPQPQKTRREALEIIRSQKERADGWLRYRNSLPESWRDYLSDSHDNYAREAGRLRQIMDSVVR